MTAIWQTLAFYWQAATLAAAPLGQWRQHSWVGRWIGWLSPWQAGSVLLPWGDAIAAGIIALTFIAAPFVSTGVIGILLVAGAGLWGLLALSDRPGLGQRSGAAIGNLGRAVNQSVLFTPIHLLLLLYWGIATIATAFSPVRTAALVGWGKLTLYLLFFALMARVLRVARWRSALLCVYLLVALWVSVYGLRQWFFGVDALATWVDAESPLAKTTRVYSYLGNPNLLAGYLLPAIPISIAALFAWRRWLPKALAATSLVVSGSCLVLTFSRGGWIALVAALGVMTVLLAHWWSVRLPGMWRQLAIPLLLGAGVLLVSVAIATVEPLRLRVMSIFAGREDSSNNFRLNVWMSVIDMIRDHPILGIGPGNSAFNKVYPLYQRPKFTALSAYSIPLEIAVETGLVGLTCFLWFLVTTVSQGWRQLNRLRSQWHADGYWLMAALATMVGMLAHGLVDTVWYRPQVNMLWWLAIAIVASYYQPLPSRPKPPTHSNT
jgi:putative inorganic carbon (HCO3(-)) transporter